MTGRDRVVLICSCEDTMALDPGTVGKGCGARVEGARHLCRSQLDRFRTIAKTGAPLTVACTQEAPLFEEVAEDEELPSPLTFVNIRETAGWSAAGRAAAPKMAALIAMAQEEVPAPAAVTFESEGVALICGRDQTAIDLAIALKDHLDLTVLLDGSTDVVPPRQAEFPIRKGRITKATGHLGAFELTIAGYAEPAPSSRQKIVFGPGRDGAVSRADIVIDVTGGTPLFASPDLRDGYLRAAPGDLAGLQRLTAKAADLVGTFDKPRYINFREDLCAHARSRKTGCSRCLDVCPAGAISPAGNTVAIDAYICGGCGACSAVCPTGAAAYSLPGPDGLVRKLRALLSAYRAAQGTNAVVLFHDERHGADMIEALARFGDGLPANVLPVPVNEVTQVGLEAIAACFAYGAAGVRLLTRAKPLHDISSVYRTVSYAEPILTALGFGRGLVSTIEADDPDDLGNTLANLVTGVSSTRPASFLPLGTKREVLNLTLRELHRAAPTPVDVVTIPAGAPFGRISVDVSGCTLCLSCVSACPTRALSDAADHPALKFDESLCVQCGLCQSTCPERVISLEPRLDFAAYERGATTLKEEEPFCCVQCGKPFGVRSTIERIVSKLEGQHWMFSGAAGAKRLELVRMCDTCRIETVTNEGMDPYATTPRPTVRTSDDYFRERSQPGGKPKGEG